MTDEKNPPQPADASEATPVEPGSSRHGHAFSSAADDRDVTLESVAEAFAAMTDGPDAVDESAPAQYGIGPFSVREVALGAVWVVAFVLSFFPVYGWGTASVWSAGIDWVLTIGVPTVAVFLVGLRRLSPQGIRRVGSLGVDQFASVAFSVSTVVWLGILWSSFISLANQRVFLASWVVWVEFVLMLAGVLLTVFAPLFPTIGEDFRHRSEVPAHRFASPARPVVPRPAVPAPAAASTPEAATAATPEPAAETPAASTPPASQAFWALAPEERAVVDPTGAPLFLIGPTAWALVIEDRGDVFVVRHEDGRIGHLTDVSGVMRG